MMLHLKQVFSAEEVRHARGLLEQGEWTDGRATSGSLPGALKQNRQLPEQSAGAAPLQAMVLAALRRNQMFFSAALPRQVATPMFNRYGAGGDHLGDHVDVAMRFMPDGSRVRTDVSCTLFLSEPDEYEGGELVVADPWEDKRIKLPAGDMLLYSAATVHRVEPVRSGVRYASFFWTESMVREGERRRLLFDMDCQLMSLRARLPGDDPAVVGLGATYHNLLRMWASS
ncbi:Fe2+-dependent dioxygenase [Herbaspirillum robiniae]|uniref:Fe2+-dependent dioxygenase n=1 Tax=Herbaspirillum robiniae TaxID=2014887 RepID=UPI003D780DD0